jgi:cobalt-zinc-cadmium resistance protein CzcA
MVSAASKDELADKIKAAIKGNSKYGNRIYAAYRCFQRINFRYEIDVAVKVFGEDLNVLARKAQEIKRRLKSGRSI